MTVNKIIWLEKKKEELLAQNRQILQIFFRYFTDKDLLCLCTEINHHHITLGDTSGYFW